MPSLGESPTCLSLFISPLVIPELCDSCHCLLQPLGKQMPSFKELSSSTGKHLQVEGEKLPSLTATDLNTQVHRKCMSVCMLEEIVSMFSVQ